MTHRNCPASPGVGDWVERWAKFFGFKAKPGCGCARRKWKLNHWSAIVKGYGVSFVRLMRRMMGFG